MTWKPNITVATVTARDGKILMIEKKTGRSALYNPISRPATSSWPIDGRSGNPRNA
jgi:hypothetical protein